MPTKERVLKDQIKEEQAFLNELDNNSELSIEEKINQLNQHLNPENKTKELEEAKASVINQQRQRLNELQEEQDYQDRLKGLQDAYEIHQSKRKELLNLQRQLVTKIIEVESKIVASFPRPSVSNFWRLLRSLTDAKCCLCDYEIKEPRPISEIIENAKGQRISTIKLDKYLSELNETHHLDHLKNSILHESSNTFYGHLYDHFDPLKSEEIHQLDHQYPNLKIGIQLKSLGKTLKKIVSDSQSQASE